MTQYVLSTGAELDLDEIWEYIAEDNLNAADRWIKKLFDAFEMLARAPGMGHKREDLTAFPVLFWPVGAYTINLSGAPEACRNRCCHPGCSRYPVLLEPVRPIVSQTGSGAALETIPRPPKLIPPSWV
jgi:plasmid stabilization system protein ParE